MFIDTTINISNDCFSKISKAAATSAMSHSEIIVRLMKNFIDITEPQVRCGRSVQYQERRDKGNWSTIHVRFKADEYEYFQDMRKLMKMSISLIISLAADKFLKKLMNKKNIDNYHINNYVILKRTINGIIHWTFIWGFPRNISEYINQT